MYQLVYRNNFLGDPAEHIFGTFDTRETAEAALQDLVETWALLDISFEIRAS